MLKNNKITVLELSPNGLDIILAGLIRTNGIEYTQGQKRYIIDPYKNSVKKADKFEDMYRQTKAVGMEDIYYVCDINTFNITNLPGFEGVVKVNIASGVRINHSLDKEFCFIYMDTSTNKKKNAQEIFCGEWDTMVNIPCWSYTDKTVVDITSEVCVFNN